MFVNGIVQHLENAVMQPALVRVADIHAGPFADGFQPLQLVNFRGVVLSIWIRLSAHFPNKSSQLWRRNCSQTATSGGLKRAQKEYEKTGDKTTFICVYLREKAQLVVAFGGGLRQVLWWASPQAFSVFRRLRSDQADSPEASVNHISSLG
jgi:hypothetical protein